MMSRTSDCEPKDTANPNTPAPAISGAVSTPSRDNTINTAKTPIATPKKARIIGKIVCSREAGVDSSSSSTVPGSFGPPGMSCRLRSIASRVSSQMR